MTIKQLQVSATMHLRDGNRFIVQKSQIRIQAIKSAIESQFGIFTMFDDSEQVESRGSITESEIIDYINSAQGKKFIKTTEMEADQRYADFMGNYEVEV